MARGRGEDSGRLTFRYQGGASHRLLRATGHRDSYSPTRARLTSASRWGGPLCVCGAGWGLGGAEGLDRCANPSINFIRIFLHSIAACRLQLGYPLSDICE
jgi:hypothetical protein